MYRYIVLCTGVLNLTRKKFKFMHYPERTVLLNLHETPHIHFFSPLTFHSCSFYTSPVSSHPANFVRFVLARPPLAAERIFADSIRRIMRVLFRDIVAKHACVCGRVLIDVCGTDHRGNIFRPSRLQPPYTPARTVSVQQTK